MQGGIGPVASGETVSLSDNVQSMVGAVTMTVN